MGWQRLDIQGRELLFRIVVHLHLGASVPGELLGRVFQHLIQQLSREHHLVCKFLQQLLEQLCLHIIVEPGISSVRVHQLR